MKARKNIPGGERLPLHATWPKASAVTAIAAILATAIAGASQDASSADIDAMAEQTTGAVCASACHGWDVIFNVPRQTPGQWDFIVSDMAGRGAEASDEQLDLVRHFLKREWSTVWINSASAQDLEAVLALPEEEADAVIAYRDERGKFTDLDSLKQVPGIDAATIDAQADAITFN